MSVSHNKEMPMPYATKQDIIDRHGEDVLYRVADRDGDDILEERVVNEALADATEEINTYLAARYPLPLVSVPPIAKRLCIDIAVYHMSGDLVTEQQENRYDNAVKLLKSIAKGDASLGLPAPDQPTSNEETRVSAPSKMFGKSTLDRF